MMSDSVTFLFVYYYYEVKEFPRRYGRLSFPPWTVTGPGHPEEGRRQKTSVSGALGRSCVTSGRGTLTSRSETEQTLK